MIEVPKIALGNGIARRAELRESRVVELRRDMARHVEVRHRTAMEVMQWCSDLPRRGVALTSEERYSMLLCDARLWLEGTAGPGRKTKTGRRSEDGGGGAGG